VDDPSRPSLDLRRREEAALRALAVYKRARERAFRRRLSAALMLALPVLLAAAWFIAVGSQRHVLEIRVGDARLRLVSHEGPYQLEVPNDPELAEIVAGGAGAVIRDRFEGTVIQPRTYEWASLARTEQVVTREPGDPLPMDFLINGRRFRFVGSELRSAGRRWLLQPGRTIEINVDVLPRPVGGSSTAPLPAAMPAEPGAP
jgi:hypothetical protein